MDKALWNRVVELSQLRLRYWYAWQVMKPYVKTVGGPVLRKVEEYKSECRASLREAQQKLDMMLHKSEGWDILPELPKEDLESLFEKDLTQVATVLRKLEGKAGEISGAW